MRLAATVVMRMLVVGQNSRHRVFTLLEVIIVLVLLSTVLALVIPKMGSLAWGVRRSAAINTINSAFHMASSVSSATGKPSRLVFNFEDGTLSVKRSAANSQGINEPRADGLTRESIFQDVEQFILPVGTKYDTNFSYNDDESNLVYRFFPNGEAAGSKVSIMIAGTHPLVIDIDRLTGKPLFYDYKK